MKNLSAGVDLGGTWMRVVVADRKGRVVRRFKLPAPVPRAAPRRLGTIFRHCGFTDLSVLVLGSKGVWTPAERRAMARRLSPLANTVRVLSDAELALESALTPRRRPPGRAAGIVVLAGTGSIAIGRDRHGRWARAGGRGPLQGDEGSGYWIGNRFRIATGRDPKTSRVAETAAWARTIIRKARRDDLCREIVSSAQSSLAGLAWEVAKKLKMKGGVPVSWAGSLFQDREFRRGVIRLLRMIRGEFTFRPRRPIQDPAEAAARWGAALKETKAKDFPERS